MFDTFMDYMMSDRGMIVIVQWAHGLAGIAVCVAVAYQFC